MFQRKIHRVLLKGCHALSDNRRKKFDFPKSCPQSRLSEQILHIRPPNSSMLCLGMLQRKIHSVLLKEYHELFKNRPKKIWFSKSCPHTVLSEQILHMQPPKSSMLCFDMFQQKIYSVLLKVYHELFENRPKKIWFSKSCPHTLLSKQILHMQPPKSSMLCFDMFQRKVYSVLLKVYHELFKNRPKKFWFPKVVHIHYCPSKYFTCSHPSQVCCALICSNERSIASCSRSIMNSSKIAQRNFDFPKVVHKADCPSKYFEFHHQNQVCCALIYSNERSIASCAKAITRYHQIAPKKLSLQPLRGS